MPFFETSLLEFHRGAKNAEKNPKHKKAQLSGSNSLEVELQSRETEKHAESQELRKNSFSVYLQKCSAKALFSQQLPGPLELGWLCPSTCLTPSTENGDLQRQIAHLPTP